MLFNRIRNRCNEYDRKLDAINAEFMKITESQQKLLLLCLAMEERLIHIEERLEHVEERLIHAEERLEHLEERCQIMDEDKIEDMRSRLIHIEDKVNIVMNQNTGDIVVSLK